MPSPEADFLAIFKKATGLPSPYDYQRRLACGADETGSHGTSCQSQLIEIPTGLGKTAAVILAWLWNRVGQLDIKARKKWPRRLVYCLPMRTLVEQTAGEVKKWLKNLLAKADELGLDQDAKAALKWLTANSPFVLMGGEDSGEWDIHPEKETILIGTQDMLLSRALNRGYGMSRYRWPMHFGLLNNDALWVFDEVQLMGSGLPTTAQLEAFRQKLESIGTCRSWWMSATSERGWLKTVDFDPESLGVAVRLRDEDLSAGRVTKLLDAPKLLERAAATSANLKALSKEIATAAESSDGLTLVVVNTVKTARKLFTEVEKLWRKTAQKPLLLHSRFRPDDRAAILRQVLDSEGTQRIVISTQVIEAGVDLSAATLFTEIAPWSSLVQRFGRCNRRGDPTPARVYWFEPASPMPYPEEQLKEAALRLNDPALTDVSPNRVRSVPTPAADRPLASHVIRRKDLIELFDTTPDLAGNDLDIDRYIRDADDRSVQIFWRDWERREDWIPPAVKTATAAAPERHELCSAPIGEFRGVIESGVTAFVWDFLERRWQKAEAQRLVPGQNYLLHVSSGRYTPTTGWNLDSPTPVSDLREPDETKPPEDNDADALSERAWDSIAGHTEKVVAELETILSAIRVVERPALELAARWHDRGKAHETFQAAVVDERNGSERPGHWRSRRDIGKAPGGRHGWWSRYTRKHFRHELASAMAALHPSAGLSIETRDLVAYLIAAHHGKVRLSLRSLPEEKQPPDTRRFARGVWHGDKLDEVDLGGGVFAPEVVLSLEPMELGECVEAPFAGEASWIERALKLRDDIGPFRLAYLEALLRAADERASHLAPIAADGDAPIHELGNEHPQMAGALAGAAAGTSVEGAPARRGAEHGIRGRTSEPAVDRDDSRPLHATRYLETTHGTLSYTQLAPLLAERVTHAEQAILRGEFAERPLDEDLIRELHHRCCGDLVPDWAGKWRTAEIRVGQLHPPLPHEVPLRMRDYASDLAARWPAILSGFGDEALEALAFAEGRLICIHPFLDFNGRTTRLLLVEILRRANLPHVSLTAETPSERQRYFAALREAERAHWSPLMSIWKQRWEQPTEAP